MQKLILSFLLVSFCASLCAKEFNQEYESCKNSFIGNCITASANYYFVKATTDIKIGLAGNTTITKSKLDTIARNNAGYLRYYDCVFDGEAADWSDSLKWKFYLNYQMCVPQKYELKNTVCVREHVGRDSAEYVLAIRKNGGIIWETPGPGKISFSSMVRKLAERPDLRNELLFFEALSPQELAQYRGQVKTQLSMAYGMNAASILLGEPLTAIEEDLHDKALKSWRYSQDKFTLEELLTFVNVLPDQTGLLHEISRRFQALGMKKCAGRFRDFAASGTKIEYNRSKTTAPAISAPGKPVPAKKQSVSEIIDEALGF